MNTKEKKPRVKLIGRDGNAFAIIGSCRTVAKKAGWDGATIQAITQEMMAGDYDHLLQVATQYFDVY